MWIQVRSMDGNTSSRIDDLSKLTKIEELRKVLVTKFNAPVEQQRLFYRGKQLEDGHTLFDYNVGLNDIVQILIKKPDLVKDQKNIPSKQKNSPAKKQNKENEGELKSSSNASDENLLISSKYYKVGDLVDAKDSVYGAWFEAKIVSIRPLTASDKNILQSIQKNDTSKALSGMEACCKVHDDGLIYRIVFEDYEDCEDPVDLQLHYIRPRARKLLKFEDLKEGDVVMVNHNIEDPKERGFWYDCKVTALKKSRAVKEIVGSLIIGLDETELQNCKIIFTDEIFAVENTKPLLEQLSSNDIEQITRFPKVFRAIPEKNGEEWELNQITSRTDYQNIITCLLYSGSKKVICSHCKDNPSRKCKICSCHVCGGKDSPDKQIMCDECDYPYHLWCIKPPLTDIPDEDEWFCPNCKNDETEVVRAGEKLKASKKKSKMASANSSSSRDWGKGMACVGRTTECTIVPPNHFGPIPGIEVGTMWKFRVQVSESGVHRPHVAGIHGREKDGAYSIVLSGGYEDDLDEGDEFKYTGSGGRDLSGNKRCAEQSCDQTLTRMNKALALNCNAKLNSQGAEASEWKGGKPVRVVRNCKGRKHSEYCPEEGNRYDGIYKIVKYWPEKGKAGYLVWRYLLRRDDPSPAPWTKTGKKRTKELGLTMQYPDGYLESVKQKEMNENSVEKKGKRENCDSKSLQPIKKRKSAYTLPSDAEKFITKDVLNKKIWDECLEIVAEGSQNFLKKVENSFSCICCQDVVFQPITTVCLHNICKPCLVRSFKAGVYSCPMCRQELEKSIVNKPNGLLQKALLVLFPGYDAGR